MRTKTKFARKHSIASLVSEMLVAVSMFGGLFGLHGCGGGSSTPPPPPAITVSVSPPSATVQAGATQGFTVTVNNDSANKGVNWSVSCSASSCGSVSPTSTASGTATTYTAPGPPASSLTVTISATSVADTTKSGSATITVPAISVAVAPPSANVPVKGTQQFTATVSNDAANKGVTWTLTQGGAACSSGCGTITAATPSGSPATYTAPAVVPANPAVTVTATSVADGTKSATATATVVGVTVSVAPPSASVVVNTTQNFIATVMNDVSNSGVIWTLTQGGAACAPATCGSVAPASTVSGAATTYTAPAAPPPTPTVTLTATSVADPTKSGTATITVTPPPPISVSVAPATASVAVNATQQFTATVTNDPSSAGVTWTLTQGGAACASATCGSVSPASGSGNTPMTTYTAPSTVPTPATVTLTATSVTDKTKTASATISVTTPLAACGSGNESLLAAGTPYAFLVRGFDANGPVAMAGSFTPDGKGGITAGEEDINRTSGPSLLTINPTGSFYTIGADNRGCLTLTNSATTTTLFRFVLSSISGTPAVAAKGRIIEFDDTTGTGTRGSGIIRKQDATSFAASLSGIYAFGVSGTNFANRFAEAGTFVAGAGTFMFEHQDVDDGGVLFNGSCAPPVCFGYSPPGSLDANGRGTSLGPTVDSGGFFVDMAFYQVSASEAIFISIDAISFEPIMSGEALLETVPTGGYSSSSLSGNSVFHVSTAGATTGTTNITIGLAIANGSGTFTSVIRDQDNAGTVAPPTTLIGVTYSVAGDGRVTLGPLGLGTPSPPVLYLVTTNTGFIVGTDPGADTGFLEPQVGSSFSATTLNAAYSFGVADPSASGVSMNFGVVTPNGSGSFTGTVDSSSTGGLTANQAISGTYTVTSNGTGSITDQSGNPGALIVISSSKFLLIVGETATNTSPSVTVVEK